MESITHISLNSFHKTLNSNPCNPLVNNLVGKPLPNNAKTPSAAMISLAAVTIHQRRDHIEGGTYHIQRSSRGLVDMS